MSYSKKPKTIDPNEVDPSVYYYDEVYDDMKTDEKKPSTSRDVQNKQESKYIKGLIETAEQRKTEKEIRQFKRYTKDKIEAESRGELEHTDVYITSSYKSRLEDIRRLEEDKKRRTRAEKDSLMNFTNKAKKEGPSEPNEQEGSTKSVEKRHSPPTDQGIPDKIDDSKEEQGDPSTPRRRPLKTIEDRREFLKEILAKRTIGPVFDAALRRYKERRRAKNRS